MDQALHPLDQPLERGDRLRQKAQPLLQLGNGSGQVLNPARRRAGKQRERSGHRAEQQHDQHHGDDRARDVQPLERAQRRLQHEHQHEGQHDRQDQVGSDVTDRDQREKEQPAEKDGADFDDGLVVALVARRHGADRDRRGAAAFVNGRDAPERGAGVLRQLRRLDVGHLGHPHR